MIDLMPITGLYNLIGPKFEVVRGFIFFYFSDMCISRCLKAKKRIRNGFNTILAGF